MVAAGTFKLIFIPIVVATLVVSVVALIFGIIVLVKIENQLTSVTLPKNKATDGPPPSVPPGWTYVANMLAASVNTSADPCTDFYQYACGSWAQSYKKGSNFLMAQITMTSEIMNLFQQNEAHMLFLDQATLYKPTIYYTTPAVWNRTRPIYEELIRNVTRALATEINMTLDDKKLNKDINDMIDLEFELARYNVPTAKQRDATKQYNLYTLEKLHATWTGFNWQDYFQNLADLVRIPFSYFVDNRQVCVVEPSYQNQLHQYLNKNLSSNSRLTQNYMLWRMIAPQLAFLPGYKDVFVEFEKATRIDESVTTSDAAVANNAFACTLATLNSPLAYAVSRVYVEKVWNVQQGSQARIEIGNMIHRVLQAFQYMVAGLPWMDGTTQKSAYAKIRDLVKNVAYPDWMMNDTVLNNYYEDLSLNPQDDLFTVLQKTAYFGVDKMFQRLLETTDRHNTLMAPAIVNAWYQAERNSITIPAGILNPPFFGQSFPDSVNYGGIGVVLGHELTHGFDDQGVQWDSTGHLNPWIDKESMKGFKKMAQCVVDEYDTFCYPKSSHLSPNCNNGTRTQGENIADNGGIKAAWNAYKTLQLLNGVQPRLPGKMSQFSQDQLFFLSFANVWCGTVDMERLQKQLLIDPHSPSSIRVNGTIRNVAQLFGPAFNCRVGSPMVPASHCTVW